MCLFILLGVVIVVGYLTINNRRLNSEVEELKGQIYFDIYTGTTEFGSELGGYNTVTTRYIDFEALANDVSGNVVHTLTKTSLDQNDLNLLSNNVQECIGNNIDSLGVDLTDKELEAISNGIEAIVYSAIYRSVLENQSDNPSVELLQQMINEKLSFYENEMNTSNLYFSDSLAALEKTLNNMNQTDYDKKIQKITSDIVALQNSLSGSNGTINSNSLRNINSLLNSLDDDITSSDSQLSSLKEMLLKVQSEVSGNDSVSTSTFSELQRLLNESTSDLDTRINDLSATFTYQIRETNSNVDSSNKELSESLKQNTEKMNSSLQSTKSEITSTLNATKDDLNSKMTSLESDTDRKIGALQDDINENVKSSLEGTIKGEYSNEDGQPTLTITMNSALD